MTTESRRGAALALHEAGDLDAAAAAYEGLLADVPDDIGARYLLAALRWQQGRHGDAWPHAQAALDLAPDDAAILALVGNIHYSCGRHHDAARAWQASLARDPDQPRLHSHLGVVAQDRGELKDAIAHHRAAIRMAPALGEAWYNLGRALHADGALDEALASYRVALGMLPGDPDVLNNLGNLHQAGGDLDAAAEAYEAALLRAPGRAELHHNLGAVRRAQGELAAAVAALREAVRLAPGYQDARLQLGVALGEDGQLSEAAAVFRAALERDPRSLMGWIHLGHTFKAMGREGAALVAYQNATRHAPEDAASYLNLGIAHHNRGELAEAIRCYREAVRLAPDDSSALHLLHALTGETPAAAPDGYVAELFDAYAEQYDGHVADKLGYRAPEALREALDAALPGRRYARALDIGCGTGLAAPAFADVVDALTGVDLSPGMLERAEQRGGYDSLHCDEAARFLDAWGGGPFELFVAADTVIYIGDLAPLLAAMGRCAAPGAVAAFTVEETTADGFLLRESGRFAHNPAYVRDAARAAGWQVSHHGKTPLRREEGRWIDGHAFILTWTGR